LAVELEIETVQKEQEEDMDTYPLSLCIMKSTASAVLKALGNVVPYLILLGWRLDWPQAIQRESERQLHVEQKSLQRDFDRPQIQHGRTLA
jgi:hypothetical protein